jgi:hypothetical protein
MVALQAINNAASSGDWTGVDQNTFDTAGVIGVTVGNLSAVQTAVQTYYADIASNLTVSQIQTVVDAELAVASLETATTSVDLSDDTNNAVADSAKTTADSNVTALSAGTLKTNLGTRVTNANVYIVAADTVEGLVVQAESAQATAESTTDKTNIDAYETAHKTAVGDSEYSNLNTQTKTTLDNRLATAKAAVADEVDFAYAVTQGADNQHIKVVFDTVDVTNFSTGYTVSKSANVNGDTITITATDGSVAASADGSGNAGSETGTITVTITHDFWGKSDTVTVDVTDSSSDSIVVNAD